MMLNTDLHNPNNKKKMTLEEFIRNNRGINRGENFPVSLLEQIYHSIARDEIKISSDSADVAPGSRTASLVGAQMTTGRWFDLLRRAPEGVPFLQVNPSPSLDVEVFLATAGPTLAALTRIFDNAVKDALLEECRDGFLALARLAAYFKQEDFLDDVMAALDRYTNLQRSPSVLEGEFPRESTPQASKAKNATSAASEIATQYRDQIRASWRNRLKSLPKWQFFT